MKFNSVLLFLALTLCVYCTSVLGNDLQLEVQVLGCNNEPIPGATVRISGCVDNNILGDNTTGIWTATDGTGVASFRKWKENSIQYCWGSADNKCKIEVLRPIPGVPASAEYDILGLTYQGQSVSPKEWICKAKKCCHPCNNPESFCTDFIKYDQMNPTLVLKPRSGCPPACNSRCLAAACSGDDCRGRMVSGTCSGALGLRRALLQSDSDYVRPDELYVNDDGSLPVSNATMAISDTGRKLLSGGSSCGSGYRPMGSCSGVNCGVCCVRSCTGSSCNDD